jgi:hypothetical protein
MLTAIQIAKSITIFTYLLKAEWVWRLDCTCTIQKTNPEMRGFDIWGAMMRPKFFDVPEELKKRADDWRANSATDPDKITEQKAARDFGAALVHWIRLRDAPKGTQWKPA